MPFFLFEEMIQEKASEERLYASLANLVASFDSVVGQYIDGVPRPTFTASNATSGVSYFCNETQRDTRGESALCSTIEFLPLHDESSLVSEWFRPLCSFESTASPSSRIGCNFSLFVGSFSFIDTTRGMRSVERLRINNQRVAVPLRLIETNEGHLPLASFIQALDPQPLQLHGTQSTFLTADPEIELSNTPVCKIVTVDSGKRTQSSTWEVCEIIHHDPTTSTYKVRLPRVKDSSGNPVEKLATRAALSTASELRSEEHTTLVESASLMRAEYERQFRTELVLDLWESDESSSQAMGEDVIKRVLRLTPIHSWSKDNEATLTKELQEMRMMCGRALNQAKLSYLALHPHFRKLLRPLDISFPACEPSQRSNDIRTTPRVNIGVRHRLEDSIRWRPATKLCLENITRLWNDKYGNIVLLDTAYGINEKIAFPTFVRNARNSLEVGVALMRVSLLSDVDVVMMTDLHESGVTYNHVSLDAYRSSSLCKIFLFAQVFLSSSMRNLARASALSIENLFKVVTPLEPAEFGVPSDSYYLINGKKQPNKAQLVIDLKYIEGGTVRTFPELQRVENELLELIDDMTKELNHFPKPDVPVMASLQVPIVFMDVVPPTDDAVLSAKQAVQRAVADAGPIVSRLVDVYSQHSRLVEKFVVSEAEYFQDDTTNDEVIERIENEVFALRKIVSQVTWSSADFVSCGILAVDCTHAKQTLLRLWETKVQDLLVMLERKIFETSLQAVRICRKMRLRLVTRPTCVEELDELLTYSEDAKKAIALIRERDVTNVVSWVSLLERLQHPVNEDAFSQAYQLVSWPSMIDEAMEASEKSIIVERTSMAAELETYKSKVYAMIRDLNEGVTGLLHNHSEQEKSDVAVTLARSLRLLTEEIEERIVVATRREGMLGMELSDYSEFFPIRSTFEALEQFWVTLSNSTEHLQRFYDTPIAEANSDKMIDAVETWRRLLHSATRSLRGYSALFSLGRKQEHCLMAFENATPVIEMLTQPGVRQIHWKEISRRLGIPPGHELLPTDPTVTIQRILSEGAMDHIDDIAAIVSQAATDFAAETHLEKMKSDTRRQLLVFETLEMPAGQVNVLANGQEINALIDNFVMQSQHLHSRYNLQGGLAQVAAEWETMLHTMQDTMQLWISLQTIWLQLRPTVLAPNESASVVSVEMVNKFRQVDDLFRQILDELDRPNQNLFVVMTIETLPNRLLHVSNQLTTVRDGILLLMDAKRAAFPRFYFLNDKEMLTCLSALNTRAVIGLLQRMYPRLAGLDLFKGDVSGFVSSDGVRMRCEPNYAVTSEPIEIWMHGLEAALVKALRSAVEFALNDFSKTQARVWLLRYSGQLVDVVLRVRYAVDLEEVLSTVGTKGLTAYLKKSLRMLEEYFHVSGADLGQFEHRVVSNSIAFLLYCREEVQALIDEGVHSVEHLEGFPIIRTVMQGGALRVKLFHMTVPYGNEFLGNYSAPIMTPIMFRSVRTMLLSYISCTKSILAGTGGIGKRQTMGDFATYLGAFLWSVQCHEHMTLATLAPLFRALVGIGGWLCLDDIDLLRPEILTEVCKILDAVDVAQRSTTNAGSIIEVPLGKLPGEMISLQVGRQFNLMATSSVSYEGLPATISTSFRPIFLQAVDFAVIAKTYLCALGFENEFVSLGDAIGSIFQQFHDVLPGVFSVRSLVMILRSARNIKTAPTLSARLSIALRDAISPAVKCFNQEMELLFEARVSAISTDHDALTMSFAAGPEETVSTHSLLDFERTMFVQSNVIVYGAHYSGKRRVITDWARNRNTVVVSPRCISSGMYYGEKGVGSGLLASLFRECAATGEHLLLFEGVNLRGSDCGAWSQCASSQRNVHVDDTTCVVMSSDTCVIATCTTIQDASPGIIARFGLFSSGETCPWQEQLRVCGTILTSDSEVPQVPLAMGIMEVLIPSLLDSICSPHISVHDAVTLATTFFLRWYRHTVVASAHTARLTSDRIVALMVQCCVFATAWSIGQRLDPEDREAFEEAFLLTHDAVSSVVCQHDSTIDIFPPGDILSYVATASGWRPLLMDESTESWCHSPPQAESRNSRGWTLCAFPAHARTHYAVEMILKSGQNVFISGAEQSGKSHILRRCTKIPSWTTVHISVNNETTVSLLQDVVAPRMTKRQPKVYGAAVGKQFVICVDDVHLGALEDDSGENPTGINTSHVEAVLSFLGRRQRLCTESLGVVGMRETTFIATGLPTSWCSAFTRCSLEVRLPAVRGSDVIRYLWTLLERCSSHRNLTDVGRDITAFLIVAHDAFLRSPLGGHQTHNKVATKDQRSYVFLENHRGSDVFNDGTQPDIDDEESELAERNSNPGADEEADAFWGPHCPLHLPWARIAEPNANQDIHRLFSAFDGVRRLLLSPIPDTHVVRAIASEVCRSYAATVETDKKQEVEDLMLDVAHRTIASTDKSLVEAADVSTLVIVTTETNTLEYLAPLPKRRRVAEWVACYNKAPAVELAIIPTPFANVSQVSLTNSHGGLAAFRNKMLLSYKLNQMAQQGHVTPKNSASNNSGVQSLETNLVTACTTTTMMTEWLHSHIPPLLSLMQPLESHVALFGTQIFGITRLVRIACAISDIPLFICQSDKPNYDHSSWREDLRNLLRYAAKKNVRIALFVPNVALSIPGVLADIDFIVRTGSCAPYFSSDELRILLDTAKKASSEKSEPSQELEHRFRQQTMIITHFSSTKALQNAQLSFPAFASSIQALHSGDRKDWSKTAFQDLVTSSLMQSYAIGIEGDHLASPGTSVRESHPDEAIQKHTLDLISDAEQTSALICEIFTTLASDDDGIVEEQAMEFAQLVGFLQKKRIPEVLIRHHQLTTFHGIKSRINECTTLYTQSKKELTPELEQLNDSITKLERSVTSQTSIVDGHRRSFEMLEGSTLQMVNAIDGRTHQQEQFQKTMETQLQAARESLLAIEPKQVKLLSQALVPPARARVLMDAVYLILGEEVPKSATTQQEVWNAGRKLVCDAANFLPRITAVGPDAPWLPSFEELKPMLDSFDAARFGSFSPYAQAIADLLIAIMGAVAMREKCIDIDVQISDSRMEMLSLVDDLEKARDTLFVSSKRLDDDRNKLSQLRDRRSFVFESLQKCDQRLSRLFRLSANVETFETYLKKGDETDQHQTIFGDIFLCAAQISIIGTQSALDMHDSLESIRSILKSKGIAFSAPLCAPRDQTPPTKQLITFGHDDDSDSHSTAAPDQDYVVHLAPTLQQEPMVLPHQMLGVSLPPGQTQLLAALAKRAFFRWPLFASSNILFEDCIIQQLKDSCSDCVVVNASAPNLPSIAMESMRQGYGLLVRNFNGADVLRQLRSILSLLPSMIRHGNDALEPLVVQAFGKPVAVHPRFYIVFTVREAKGELAVENLRSLQQWLVVQRLTETVDAEGVTQHVIISNKNASCGALMNEMRMRVREQRTQLAEFHRSKFAAAKLITERQQTIADDETTIAELGTEVGRMERSSVQMERQRQMAENIFADVRRKWIKATESITLIVRTFQRIETKLGRDPIAQPFMVDFIEAGYSPTKFVEERFKTDKVGHLPEHEQPLMVLLGFLDKLLFVVRVGWPMELRNVFTALVLMTAQNSVLLLSPIIPVDDTQDSISLTAGAKNESGSYTPRTSQQHPLTLGDIQDVLYLLENFTSDDMLSKINRATSTWKGRVTPKVMRRLQQGAFPTEDTGSALDDADMLVQSILKGNLIQANYTAAAIVSTIGPLVFGQLTNRHGDLFTTTSFSADETTQTDAGQLPPLYGNALFRFCSTTGTPLYIDASERSLHLENLKHLADFCHYQPTVVHINSAQVDIEAILVDMAGCVRQRNMKDRRGHWFILVLEPSSPSPTSNATVDVEARSAMLLQLFNVLPSLRDSYFTTLCGNSRPIDETELVVFVLVDKARTHPDIDVVARYRSLHFDTQIHTPRDHLIQILEQQVVVQNKHWITTTANPFHYKLRCLLKGILLFHVHQAHRQRQDHFQRRHRASSFDQKLFVSDNDLKMLLYLLSLGFRTVNHDLAIVSDPYAVVRFIMILIYSSRCTIGSEEERLIKVAPKFVHPQSINTSFRFMDVLESDPEIDLEGFLKEIRACASNLCELSGDVMASEGLIRAQQLRANALLASDFTSPSSPYSTTFSRRKSSVTFGGSVTSEDSVISSATTSAQRARKSFFIPDAPNFRRSFARVADRRRASTAVPSAAPQHNTGIRRSILFASAGELIDDSKESAIVAVTSESCYRDPREDSDEAEEKPEWLLELRSLERAVARSHRPIGLLESKMLQTLQKLLVVPPTTVKQMWLPALQYPQLFLRMFMHARAKQIVDEDDALYATFVLVCVADVDRVRSTDLVLVDATLPEKRLRNQTDPNLRKRASASSTDLSWLTPEDRQQWFIEEAEPILVLRACPRTVVPTTTIPMLRSENIVSRRGDDQNDAIDVDSPLLALTRRAEGFAHSDLGQSTKTIVVEAEPVEAAGKDQFDAHDFLDDDLVGGRDFTVFLSRVDVPLRCHSVIPQANSRVWKTLIALPLIIERKTLMITRMETRRQSAMLTHASSIRRPLSGRSATSAMLLPTAPSMSRTPSANGSRMGRWRRTDAASNNGSMRDEPLRKTPSVTPQPESLKPKASVVFRDSPVNQSVEEPNIVLPKLARFYWLPVSLQYTVSAQ